MTTDIQWKLIVSTIFLTLIFSLDVVECCSKSKTTTEKPAEATDAPAEATDAPADPGSSTMMNDDGSMMTYDSTMKADSTMMTYMATNGTMGENATMAETTKPPYTGAPWTTPQPPPSSYYAANPIHAYAIFTEAIDSNYTQQKNESLERYDDDNLGFFPTDAPGGHAGQQKEWIPKTGIMGRVDFVYNGTYVNITGNVSNVPTGIHGFHVHELPLSDGNHSYHPSSDEYKMMYGKVNQGICRTSKRHYDIDGFGADNPLLLQEIRRGHGLQNGTNAAGEKTRHVGDTGNIDSPDVSRYFQFDNTDMMANLHYGHPNSILFRTVVIHQLPDYGRSPIGPRIACGIILPDQDYYFPREKFFDRAKCPQLNMFMNPDDADTLKKCQAKCDEDEKCNAIEFAPQGTQPYCCFTLECQNAEREPTLEESQGHGGDQSYVYKSYVKVKKPMMPMMSSSTPMA